MIFTFPSTPITALLLLGLTALTTTAAGTDHPGACCTRTPSTNGTGLPTNFGILLFPGFEILDVAGPASALNMLARRQTPTPNLVTISLAPGAVSTNTSIPFYETFTATHNLTSPEARNVDVLLVPGGPGARVVDPAYVEYIKRVYPCLHTLLVVCTGAGVVAQSGLLDGRKATGNKAAWKWVVAQGPKVQWVREARWVVDGNVWTTSGVAAGLDGVFAWIAQVYGEKEAEGIANLLEYERHVDARWDPFSEVWNATKV